MSAAADLTTDPPYAQWICCHDAEPYCDWCACAQSEEECGCVATIRLDGSGVVCVHCGIELDPIDFGTGERASPEQVLALLADLRCSTRTVN